MRRFNKYELTLEFQGKKFKRIWLDRSIVDAAERGMAQFRGQYKSLDLKLVDIRCVTK